MLPGARLRQWRLLRLVGDRRCLELRVCRRAMRGRHSGNLFPRSLRSLRRYRRRMLRWQPLHRDRHRVRVAWRSRRQVRGLRRHRPAVLRSRRQFLGDLQGMEHLREAARRLVLCRLRWLARSLLPRRRVQDRHVQERRQLPLNATVRNAR